MGLSVSPTYVELILETAPGADRDRLQDDLRARGFDPLPAKVGLVLSGEVSKMRELFPALEGSETGDVTIPDALKHAVRSVRIFGPRTFHS